MLLRGKVRSKAQAQKRPRRPGGVIQMREKRDLVTASMASLFSRKDLMKKAVESLLPYVDALHIFLNGYPEIPSFLEESSKITVFTSQEFGDQGAEGKLWSADRIVGYHFVCDDDLIYPPDFVASTIQEIDRYHRRAVVGYLGQNFYDNYVDYGDPDSRTVYWTFDNVEEPHAVHELATNTLAYHTATLQLTREMFPDRNTVDVHLGIIGQEKKIPFIVLAHRGDWITYQPPPFTIWDGVKTGNSVIRNRLVRSREWSLEHSAECLDRVEYDASSVDYIIGYRESSRERRQALLFTLRWIYKHFAGANVVVVEQDTESHLGQDDVPPNCSVHFAYSDRPFNQSWGYNIGVKLTSRPVIMIGCSDVLLQPEDYHEHARLCTYKDVVNHSPIGSACFEEIEITDQHSLEFKPSDAVVSVRKKWTFTGGLVAIRRSCFHAIGGFDEYFEGWGAEDSIFSQLALARLRVCSLDKMGYHITHSRGLCESPN